MPSSLRRVMLRSLSLGLLVGASTACAGRARGEPVAPNASPHHLSGTVSYEAHHRTHGVERLAPEVNLPVGHGALARLRVCLFEQHGAQDLRVSARLRNDAKIACTYTDREGQWALDVPRTSCDPERDCSRRFYLATDLCVVGAGKPQACVSANVDQGPRVHDRRWRDRSPERKLLWSNSYWLDLDARSSNIVSWNLSCPAEPGVGRHEVRCAGTARGGTLDRAHSNLGHNDEAVHAVAAASRSVELLEDLVPRRGTSRASRPCSERSTSAGKRKHCTDAVRVVIRKMRPFTADVRACPSRGTNVDFAANLRTVCIGSPFNPWIVTHELGHIVHVRWMGLDGRINADKVGWSSGDAEKSQTGEGWADFFAAASLFSPDAHTPTFNGRPIEPAPACAADPAPGEGPAAGFFWDLYDPRNASEPEDDLQLPVGLLLEIWSLFGGRDGADGPDRSKSECPPDGRNLWDFRHHMARHPAGLPDPASIMRAACLEGMKRGLGCDARPKRGRRSDRRSSRPDHR